jgi:uncharacterized protein involved in response to NO
VAGESRGTPVAESSPPVFPPGIVIESDALKSAAWYCREPYLVFFPLGIVLSWAGVGHWLLHALGYLEDYRPVYHATTQVQAFLTAFAVGFLMTMIPRRTGSRPPATWEVALCLAALLTIPVAAWQERWPVAHGAWLVLAVTLIAFAVRRFLGSTSRRRPPNAFVWIPLALAMGVAGSLMSAVYFDAPGPEIWVHELGRRLVQQGVFIGLVLGVGSLAFPLMTRGVGPPDSRSTARDLGVRALHAATGLLLAASFAVEIRYSLRGAMVLRAAIIGAVLVGGAGLWRLPTEPGANRWLVWTAGWMLPIGYLVAAALPDVHKAGLHIAFIGGFALLAMAVGNQVTLGHRGYRQAMVGRPWQVPAIGLLIACSVAARCAMEFDRSRYFLWMGLASGAFLIATLVWAQFLIPKMLKEPV